MSKPFNIKRFNEILEQHNQTLRAAKVTGKIIELSNGKQVTKKTEIERCKKRVLYGHKSWKENFDLIYGLDPDVATHAEQKARAD